MTSVARPDAFDVEAFRSRIGQCFELSARYVSDHWGILGIRLVHGTIQRDPYPANPHAWVTFTHGGETVAVDPVLGAGAMPLAVYVAWANAVEVVAYTEREPPSGSWSPVTTVHGGRTPTTTHHPRRHAERAHRRSTTPTSHPAVGAPGRSPASHRQEHRMPDRAAIEAAMDEWMEDVGELPPVPDDVENAPLAPPTDEAQAQTFMRRLKRLDRARAEVTDTVQTEITRLQGFLADRVAGIERAARWDERNLDAWMRQQALASGGKRTVKVPDGELRLRPHRATVLVNDPPAFMAYAFGIPDPVPTADDPHPIPHSLRALNDKDRRDPMVVELVGNAVNAAIEARLSELMGPARDLVRIKLEPDKTELAKLEHPALTQSRAIAPLALPGGELVPGVELFKDPSDTFGFTIGAD